MGSKQLNYVKKQSRIKSNICLAYTIIFFIILIPTFSILLPNAKVQGSWFQRSGSVITILSLIGQINYETIKRIIIPGGAFASSDSEQLRKLYLRHANRLRKIFVILTIVGTFIWGYGDLVF